MAHIASAPRRLGQVAFPQFGFFMGERGPPALQRPAPDDVVGTARHIFEVMIEVRGIWVFQQFDRRKNFLTACGLIVAKLWKALLARVAH
ncbi:hypothetical protein [Pseudorhodoferax aquiterrae]|uniref:hypothetical protein n=1 Tax=Pseudorhodoferax aquiterrae TaxID=747304 RepID=UPI001678AF05|nr:hypothetical protein [Pseudorhodoferax aquiterrae]